MALAVHFYRPDFSEGMARVLIRDMLEDLHEFTTPQVQEACRQWRRDANSKFFPTIGQLRKLASEARTEERHAAEHMARGGRKFEFGDPRPFGWEYQRKRFWKPHWRVSDLDKAGDPDRRARYDRWLERVKAGNVKGHNADEY
jgi:hypothetical protein